MYVWNGFTIVGKRADCTESLLVTIETAEEKLRNDPRELIKLLLLFYYLFWERKGDSTGSISWPTSLQSILYPISHKWLTTFMSWNRFSDVCRRCCCIFSHPVSTQLSQHFQSIAASKLKCNTQHYKEFNQLNFKIHGQCIKQVSVVKYLSSTLGEPFTLLCFY